MATTEEVAKYYDEWTQRYLDVYGDVIQAYRPEHTELLLDYLLKSMGLNKGMRLIDAGCGVCGPAIFFAEKLDLQIEALTISPVQAEIAEKKIREKGLEHRVRVRQGDFHQLNSLYEGESFDGIFFLEALGHSKQPGVAIRSCWPLLKNGGFLYIKDFFPRESANPLVDAAIQDVMDQINEVYAYNVPDFYEVLSASRETGFEIESIRKPDFLHDTAIRAQFESEFGIDLYGGKQEMVPAEWLELKFRKFVYSRNEEIARGEG